VTSMSEFDASLETHVKALYGNSGQSMTILSSASTSRPVLQIDADRRCHLPPCTGADIRYNIDSLKAASFGVRTYRLRKPAVRTSRLCSRRLSDDQTVTETTDAKGLAANVKDAADPFRSLDRHLADRRIPGGVLWTQSIRASSSSPVHPRLQVTREPPEGSL